ncbi:Na(+) H(+) antiporter subunit G [hydrothermal vent metagenome]|uniref:Na(+) H(+) antiporter subunit G n=1 Tax=hydrothermal vent metagenome TaxID=652676 RepID=A0A3B0Y3U4_9ZZZZ
MMEWITYILKWFLIAGGGIFVVIGGIGILRFPDLFTRFHAVGVTDTLGAGMILSGLMIEAGFTLISFKLLLIFLFLLITGPTATHALAKAALHGGIKPLCKNQRKPS